jgi:SMI1-KNR4 cell-wall
MNEVIETLAKSLASVSDNSMNCAQALPNNLQASYRYFLSMCDGGYTGDRFFHFFGVGGPREQNLLEWNQTDLWKKYYDLDEKSFVFAEDILGSQFHFDIRGNRRVVKILVPNSGKIMLCANTFEEFVKYEILGSTTNAEVRRLAQSFFEKKSESFRPFTHISCRIPPLLGGRDSDLDNLQLARASTNLKLVGQVAKQVKSLAPGTRIREVKVDLEKEEIVLVPDRRTPSFAQNLLRRFRAKDGGGAGS